MKMNMYPALPDDASPTLRAVLIDVKQGVRNLYGNRLQHLVLFGSQARGEASAESDVDVLVVLSGHVDYVSEVRRMLDLKMEILDQHGLVVSLKPVDAATYEDDTHPLMMNIHHDGALLR